MNEGYKLFFVFGLLVKCPEGEPMSDCPLQEYRTKSLEDRLLVAERFTENELDETVTHHYKCVRNRVNRANQNYTAF